MSNHDILCPLYEPHPKGDDPRDCRCGIIGLARDNERGRVATWIRKRASGAQDNDRNQQAATLGWIATKIDRNQYMDA